MRTLRLLAHISLDGVVQHENGDGFRHGNWYAPFRHPAGLPAILEAQGETFDLILGRRTYDLWAGHWPSAGRSTIADRINAATKYVATHRPSPLPWGPATALGGDVISEIRALKSTDGPPLLVWGSTTLTSPLLDNGLADEVVLLVYPVLLGAGKRIYTSSPAAPAPRLELVRTATIPTGVMVNTYRYAGPLQTEPAATEPAARK